jgi:thioesterase domain-containing protein/acyl carrier protein
LERQSTQLDTRPGGFTGSPAKKFSRCRAIALECCDPVKIHERLEKRTVSRGNRRTEYLAPRTLLERQCCELWQKVLRVEQVGIRDNFFDLGGHSLLAVRLFADLEKVTGRKLPLVTLFQAPTVEQLAKALRQKTGGSSASLLVPIKPHGTKPPLFLVHGAGGDVLWGYANLAGHLAPDQPLYGIKSRGQEGLEELTSVKEMAQCYLKEVRAFQPEGPYFLGGYCFGGNVAYEMARQLVAQGIEVGLVVLFDSAPSNAGYENPSWGQPRFWYRFSRNVCYWLDDFRTLRFREQRRFIVRKARALGRKVTRSLLSRRDPHEVDVEEVIDPVYFPESELQLWRIHLRALTEHVDGPYSGCVVLLRTRGQPLLCSFDEDFCWSRLARGGLTVKHIPGSHENVFMEPNVKFLALELENSLAEPGNPKATSAPIGS